MTTNEARRHARHQGRILAMQALYEADVARHDSQQVLERLVNQDEEAEDYPPTAVTFARRLLTGVLAHLPELDALIAAAAPTWPLAQMAKIDKSILRVAVYEVLKERDVPYKAAINEAVEIAKLFGSDSSSRFINGVLGTIAAHRAPAHRAAKTEGRPLDDAAADDER